MVRRAPFAAGDAVPLPDSVPPVPIVVGVVGGSGSGKTYLANMIREQLGDETVTTIGQDWFYIGRANMVDDNYDHPAALDLNMLCDLIGQLKAGKTVEAPQYDFVTHARQTNTVTVHPRPVILIDGILLFTHAGLRDACDVRLGVVCDEALRLSRRIERDAVQRGRSEESVREQFATFVKPMHERFVEPSLETVGIVVDGIPSVAAFVDAFCERIRQRLAKSSRRKEGAHQGLS